jgi:large subunit ribosomal protein L25
MARMKLEVRPREGRGGKDARALRAAGTIPGVLYGAKTAGGDSIAVEIDLRALRKAVSGPGGVHAILDLEIDGDGGTRPVIIKDLQLDPVRDRVIHVDFNEVRLDQPIHTVVMVHIEGEPHGVQMGGVLSQPTHEVNISVLPTEIPEELVVDVSALEVGNSLRLSDVPTPPGVTFLDDPDGTVLATVTAPTVEEEPEPEEGEEGEELEGEEGEAAAEGEGGEESSESSGEEPAPEE